MEESSTKLCEVCCHHHSCKEACGVCGHRTHRENHTGLPAVTVTEYLEIVEIVPKFLYVGSYSAAYNYVYTCDSTDSNLHGISHIVNTVPGSQHLFKGRNRKNSKFYFHSLHDNDAIRFLDQCEMDKAPVLLFCMTGNSRSPATAIAYLMKNKRWTLEQSYLWVKERRPSLNLSSGTDQWLEEFEKRIPDSDESKPLLLGSPGSRDPDTIPSGSEKAHFPTSMKPAMIDFKPHNRGEMASTGCLYKPRRIMGSDSEGRPIKCWYVVSDKDINFLPANHELPLNPRKPVMKVFADRPTKRGRKVVRDGQKL